MTTKITISRKWNNPKIEAKVYDAGISLSMGLDDFLIAVKQEVGSVTWVFKKATFEKQLDEAVKRVVSGIKQESAKVV